MFHLMNGTGTFEAASSPSIGTSVTARQRR
jgi:hypothetical protein